MKLYTTTTYLFLLQIWKILPLILSLALANPHKNHNHFKEPEIFSSQSNHRQLRFIFIQGYTTVTVTSGTSTLSTYPT